ncbi:hypothetical protein LJR039_004307 [Pseudorhodoferax sp. LjRoot39]|uniref:hypothetical protein n=1 Tax=Pseudorhodoferax sp. LjRoot39 TaxID=3342328 RepID=UPI003ECF03DD
MSRSNRLQRPALPPEEAARQALDFAIIKRLESVGGRYWSSSDMVHRRVYFEGFRFAEDWGLGYGTGYYDLAARRFVSTHHELTHERFAEVIGSRGPRWWEDQSPLRTRAAADRESTGLDSMHSVIGRADDAILLKAYVLDRPELDASANIGRVVYIHMPVQGRRTDGGWQGNLWRVRALGDAFDVAGKNTVARWDELLIYGEHLMRIDDGRSRRRQPLPQPAPDGSELERDASDAAN